MLFFAMTIFEQATVIPPWTQSTAITELSYILAKYFEYKTRTMSSSRFDSAICHQRIDPISMFGHNMEQDDSQ